MRAKAVPSQRTFRARGQILGLAAGVSLALAACAVDPVQSDLAESPGTVELNQAATGDADMGGGGTGTVFFHGKLYQFTISGDGVDGSAIAIIQTSGEVFRLQQIGRFAGTYRRAPVAAIIQGQPSGGLWLQNEQATVVHLKTPPGGRMPDIGTDAVRIVLDQ
jgi:hypothetical protein